MNHDIRGETQGVSTQSVATRPSVETDSAETAYHGYQDPTAPVGKECNVTVDADPLDYRYDLLLASRSGFEWGCGGSGPAPLASALLANTYDDEALEGDWK